MLNKKVIWAGLAAGVLCHILQGFGAFLIFDHFYLQSPDLVRDSGWIVAIYYLLLNLVTGLVIAHLAHFLMRVWKGADWEIGLKTGVVVWAASSVVFVIKRQILLRLSGWLALEIVADLIIYAVAGALAGYLVGRGIVEKEKAS
jgi:hypothetical protein